jgi:hypothetical protein
MEENPEVSRMLLNPSMQKGEEQKEKEGVSGGNYDTWISQG